MTDDRTVPEQEPEGLDPRVVVAVVVGALVMTVVCVLVARELLRAQRGNVRDAAVPTLSAHPQPVGEVEQSLISRTARGEAKADAARKRLNSYGTIDSTRAHIPIERAFDWMLSDAGLPEGGQ